jgi:hypothetical protein
LCSETHKSIYAEVLVSGGLISKFPKSYKKGAKLLTQHYSHEGQIDQLKNEITAKFQKALVFFRNGNIFFSGM